jgi:hypothetical protein
MTRMQSEVPWEGVGLTLHPLSLFRRNMNLICRLTAPGWENFTGNFGFGAAFKDGVSVQPLTQRQIMRIGSSTVLVNDETGEQVGPSVIHWNAQPLPAPIAPVLKTQAEVEVDQEAERKRLAAEEAARKEADAKALAEAQEKLKSAIEEQVVYTRQELEAIGSNDGIQGLRDIANPLGVKGRSISELVTEILAAQAKLASE